MAHLLWGYPICGEVTKFSHVNNNDEKRFLEHLRRAKLGFIFWGLKGSDNYTSKRTEVSMDKILSSLLIHMRTFLASQKT